MDLVPPRIAPKFGRRSGAEVLINEAAVQMLGTGPLAFVCLAATLAGWCFARDPLARRICLVFPLGLLVFLMKRSAA